MKIFCNCSMSLLRILCSSFLVLHPPTRGIWTATVYVPVSDDQIGTVILVLLSSIASAPKSDSSGTHPTLPTRSGSSSNTTQHTTIYRECWVMQKSIAHWAGEPFDHFLQLLFVNKFPFITFDMHRKQNAVNEACQGIQLEVTEQITSATYLPSMRLAIKSDSSS